MDADSGLPLPQLREDLHELNNALALVIGAAELLASGPDVSPRQHVLLREVVDGALAASRVALRLQRLVRGAAPAFLLQALATLLGQPPIG